jgi:OOP family OmpA-OmpF porin
MKTSLEENVKFSFSEETIDQLATVLGETPAQIKKGLAKAVPLVLGSLLKQAEQEGSPSALLQLAREADASSMPLQLTDVSAATWYEQGGAILVELLGSTYGSSMNMLAHEAGIQLLAAERLLQLTAAAVLGVVGHYAAEHGLTPSAFVQWLGTQRAAIEAAMLPTMQPPIGATTRAPATVPPRLLPATPPRPMPAGAWPGAAPAAAPRSGASWPWQWGLLLLLAVSLGYFFGYDRRQPAAEDAGTVRAAAPVAPAAPAAGVAAGRYDQNRDTYIYDTGQPIVLTLANGSTQKVGANSTENRLYTFLATPTVQVDSVNRTKGWINFDRVYFEPGKATLTPESTQQLHNVASILKTFPKAVVKIGGYTDSSGVALHNFQLSEERAKTAMVTLTSWGVPINNLQYKGYGAKYYITSNSTPAGRALNRRISIRVVQK